MKTPKKDTSTGRRTDHAPDPYLQDFFHQNLPHGYNYFVTDLDLVIRTREGKIMIVEVKRKCADVPTHQRITLAIIDKLIRAGLEKYADGKISIGEWTVNVSSYAGCHLLQFENTTAEDGRIYWDGHEITVSELVDRLSFSEPDAA